MGVVRRDGDWRLEKHEEGRYEITYQTETQAEVRAPEYKPGWGQDASFGLVQVHEVDSYAEAEGLFEEYAHGGPPSQIGGIGSPSPAQPSGLEANIDSGSRGGGLDFDDDLELADELEKLPPGGLAFVFLLAGGLILSTSWRSLGEPVFIIGAGLSLAGASILGWAIILGNSKGWGEAIDFLTTAEGVSGENSAGGEGIDESERAPPAPESLKNKLIFGRADQRCEWCEDLLDHPEVHHIKPRSQGGRNDESNLIVLCPTCHRKADSGGISQTKLRGKLKHKIRE